MHKQNLYKQSFDKLHPSEHLQKELEQMMNTLNSRRTRRPRKLLALAAAIVVIASLAIAASASGAFQTIRLWINGQEMDAQAYLNDDGSISVETDGVNGSVEIFTSESAGDPENPDAAYLPDLEATYVHKGAGDYLHFTDRATGQTEDLEITEKLVDGVYRDTVKVFGFLCTVDLQVDGKTYRLNFALEEA